MEPAPFVYPPCSATSSFTLGCRAHRVPDRRSAGAHGQIIRESPLAEEGFAGLPARLVQRLSLFAGDVKVRHTNTLRRHLNGPQSVLLLDMSVIVGFHHRQKHRPKQGDRTAYRAGLSLRLRNEAKAEGGPAGMLPVKQPDRKIAQQASIHNVTDLFRGPNTKPWPDKKYGMLQLIRTARATVSRSAGIRTPPGLREAPKATPG